MILVLFINCALRVFSGNKTVFGCSHEIFGIYIFLMNLTSCFINCAVRVFSGNKAVVRCSHEIFGIYIFLMTLVLLIVLFVSLAAIKPLSAVVMRYLVFIFSL